MFGGLMKCICQPVKKSRLKMQSVEPEQYEISAAQSNLVTKYTVQRTVKKHVVTECTSETVFIFRSSWVLQNFSERAL